jgi:hypothetical protein
MPGFEEEKVLWDGIFAIVSRDCDLLRRQTIHIGPEDYPLRTSYFSVTLDLIQMRQQILENYKTILDLCALFSSNVAHSGRVSIGSGRMV